MELSEIKALMLRDAELKGMYKVMDCQLRWHRKSAHNTIDAMHALEIERDGIAKKLEDHK